MVYIDLAYWHLTQNAIENSIYKKNDDQIDCGSSRRIINEIQTQLKHN